MTPAKSRYRIQPTTSGSDTSGWVDWELDPNRSITVYEADRHWEQTKLLDHNGRVLQRYVGPAPIGFIWSKDS